MLEGTSGGCLSTCLHKAGLVLAGGSGPCAIEFVAASCFEVLEFFLHALVVTGLCGD